MKKLLFVLLVTVFVTSCGTTSLLEQHKSQIERLGYCCVEELECFGDNCIFTCKGIENELYRGHIYKHGDTVIVNYTKVGK